MHLFSTLGMSGIYSTTETTHSRVRFTLDNSLVIWYNDVRNFGTMKVADQAELEKKLKELGPDMVNHPCNYEEFEKIFSNSRIKNKNLASFLMDQKRVSGIGNIYKSEICYLAAVNPARTLSSFSDLEKRTIWKATLHILKLAMEAKGSSQKDFKDVNGRDGRFLDVHANVYRKTQDKNGNPVYGVDLGDDRTTWWCPNVQI
jgi:formamidopyrimidine-DNA glycosylase